MEKKNILPKELAYRDQKHAGEEPERFRGMQSKADDTEVTVSDKQPQEFKRLPHKRN